MPRERRGFHAAALLAILMTMTILPPATANAEESGSPVACQVPGLAGDRVQEAREILRQVPLIDGHNDLPWALREQVKNQLSQIDLQADLRRREKPTHTDIPRLRQGGMGGQFWSVYVPVDLQDGAAVQAVVEQIDVVHRLAGLYPDAFEIARTAADVERIHAEGRIASLIGIEGGHSIGNSLAVLRQLYALGARYMTLTHWQNTAWADAATDDPEHGGLSDFGREVVREMNRLGMLVDLSHVAPKTMLDVLAVSEAPVIFSHSSARALVDHPRNVPDTVLAPLAQNGGVVMVTFVPSFVSEALRQHQAERDAEEARQKALRVGDPEAVKQALASWDTAHPQPAATLSQVADHIDHLRAQVGIDHVGIGSDLDGIGTTPVGLEDVSCFPALLGELLRRGYSTEEVGKVAGRNALRVLHANEQVAARLQAERPPSDVVFTPAKAEEKP